MNPSRRRKKRPNYGLRTVDVLRGPNGFGFTISGQQPCILSCIVNNSPADQAGLRAGDFLIAVSGVSVSKMAHDAVVNLIGNCTSPIQMTIAENYFSDSSDEEFDCRPIASSRRPRFIHRPRTHRRVQHNKASATRTNHVCQANVMKMRECLVKRIEPVLNANLYNEGEQSEVSFEESHVLNSLPDNEGPIEYKVVVGYLGTIEMPKQLPPNSRLQIVCNCIRILKQEKRSPTPVLLTVLPTCLTLKNASNHILAIYPTNRIVYIGTTIDRETRHFGLVTSVVNDIQKDNNQNSPNGGVEISNSCHIFVTDKKIIGHNNHLEVADSFNVTCTIDPLTGMCLEFPRSAFYIIDLIQNIYKLQCHNPVPLVANSPHPSASSNSDSGIGFRDDCDNVSDRILVVEFPTNRTRRNANKLIISPNNNKRPQGITGSNISLDALGVPSKRCFNDNFELNNARSSTSKYNTENFADIKQVNDLNNIRAFDNKDKQQSPQKENNLVKEYNRLSCRALLDTSKDPTKENLVMGTVCTNLSIIGSGIPDTKFNRSKSPEIIATEANTNSDLIDTPSQSKFRIPHSARKKKKKLLKVAKSCECLDKEKEENFWDKGTDFEPFEKYGCGSLQDLSSWSDHVEVKDNGMANMAQSEPDVRLLCGQNVPKSWAKSFEKLLEDPVGINAFAEFLKKEFSAENIYFWTACQRYAHMSANSRRKAEAQRIFHQHLEVGAQEAVNVDAKGRQAAQQGLTEAEADCFKLAEQQIFNLMKFDSYSRFLKSALYQQCMAGEIDFSNLDPRLSLTPINSLTPTRKLQKSRSNAEDGRRKSLLPWHRKDNQHRHKGKERDRSESQHHLLVTELHENPNGCMRSSQSSLSSLDFALSYQDLYSGHTPNSSHTRKALCRVRLGDNSTAVVQIKEDETIQQMVHRILEKRGLVYASFEVFTDKHPKALDISEPSLKLSGCEARVEQRVVFKLDLPNRKIIAVKSKYSKIIVDVLKPILHKYKYSLEQVTVTRAGRPLDVSWPVTEIDGEKLHVALRESCSEVERKINNTCNTNNFGSHSLRLDNVQATKLKEITNRVFEDILQEKSDFESVKPTKSDRGSVKSEDWGSEHSSLGLLGKFLRRDSAVHEKKKKLIKTAMVNKEETASDHLSKRPLIAKLKVGPCKQVVRSDSDELVEGLTRAQRRLEDQRGTEINFELPDFLKNKQEENSEVLSQNTEETNSRLSGISSTSSDPKSPGKNLSNYENYNVEVGNSTSPKSLKSESCSPEISFVTNRSQNNSESTNCRSLEPPPLPPKPKVVPIKPSNWGHNDILKGRKAKNVFFDQPSSSFV